MLDRAQQGHDVVKGLGRDCSGEGRGGGGSASRRAPGSRPVRLRLLQLSARTGNLLPPGHFNVVDLLAIGQQRPPVLVGRLPLPVHFKAHVVGAVIQHPGGGP